MVIKGNTYEEFYGKDRSRDIKSKIGQSNKRVNKHLTWEEKYGKKRAQQLKDNIFKIQKGKTFEERFGKERADEIKEKLSKNSKGKNSGSFEERFGKEKAVIEKQKRSITEKRRYKENPKGKNIDRFGIEKANKISEKISLKKRISKELIIKKYQEAYDVLGGFCKGEWNDYMFCNDQTIRNRFGSLDELAKQANREFKNSEKGKFGKNETFILDKIENDNNILLERQKVIKTDNTRYFIDGYDPVNNVAYEVDERYHNNRKEFDMIRDMRIKNKIGCNIIRIKERSFLNNINQLTLENFPGAINE